MCLCKGRGKKDIFHGVSGRCEPGRWEEKTRLEQNPGSWTLEEELKLWFWWLTSLLKRLRSLSLAGCYIFWGGGQINLGKDLYIRRWAHNLRSCWEREGTWRRLTDSEMNMIFKLTFFGHNYKNCHHHQSHTNKIKVSDQWKFLFR